MFLILNIFKWGVIWFMAGRCSDCNQPYEQFQATCCKNEDGVFQTKRYYRCHKCGTVFVEVDPPMDEEYHNGVMCLEIYPPIKTVEEKITLDKWM